MEPMRRFLFPFLVGAALGALAYGCAAETPGGSAIALRDPAALLDDIEGPLRLLVFPAEDYACDTATGFTTPNPPEERGAAMPDAIVDLSFATTESATVGVPAGEWVILVRGWGTDAVSGRTDFMIATGCITETIAVLETLERAIELKPNFGEGVCGDSLLSPDEQCEDGNTTSGDGCDADCRTEPFLVSRAPAMEAGPEILPAAAWTEGARLSVAYDSALRARDIRSMFFTESGAIIESPTALSVDAPVENAAGTQTLPSASAGGGRYGYAYVSAGTGPPDIRVRFLDRDRNPLGAAVVPHVDTDGTQSEPSIALMPDGTALVVFVSDNAAVTTGLSARLFAAASTTPEGPDAFDVGTGQTGASVPSVAASTTGFVVTFTTGGEVYYQRFGADGAPVDAMAVAVPGGSGTRGAPAAASLSDGRTAIAFTEDSTIKVQVFDAAFAAVGTPVTVGPGTAPTAAASRERFAIAYVNGSEVMARLVAPDGTFALNRNKPPSIDAFPVASGAVTVPAVAAGGTAAAPLFIVTWQDGAADPAGDINGRLFPLP
ncbi:MAG: hypothetical protein JRH11_06530 [Deltaproteobacteria bacterium]|nr:hypothetical protein [Deltaproteobacteria bacterium]